MTVPMLKRELTSRGYYIRNDTSKKEMIEQLILIYAEKRRERRGLRTMQRHNSIMSLGSPMDVDHTSGG
ncbi:MAG: hypothetical protein ACKPKO_16550 [Candidatus Fonsibacter sp.]